MPLLYSRPGPRTRFSTKSDAGAAGLTCMRSGCSPPLLPAPVQLRCSQYTQHAARRIAVAAVSELPEATAPRPSGSGRFAPSGAEKAGTVNDTQQVLGGKTVGVVGGGPGGMLCAAHLARLGAAVEVFERQVPGSTQAVAAAPLWSITLKDCAKRAIEAAGLNSDFGPQCRYEGTGQYQVRKPPRFFGPWGPEQIESKPFAVTPQLNIVAHLRAECERVYGDSVTVSTGMGAVGGNVCTGELILEDSTGERCDRQFDMVVGADGINSAVRKLIQAQDTEMHVSAEKSAAGVLCVPLNDPGQPGTFAALETPSGAPFVGLPDAAGRRIVGSSTAWVLPAPDAEDGAGICVVMSRKGGAEVAVAMTGSAEWLLDTRSERVAQEKLEAAFPHVPTSWLQQTAEKMHDTSIDDSIRVRQSTFVTCSKLASGRAVLLGDAAHAMSANLGMACNTALQDSEVLSRACIAAGGDAEKAGEGYTAARLKNVLALTEVTKRIDAAFSFKYHKDLRRFLSGLPYALAYRTDSLPKQAILPEFLEPTFSIDKHLQEREDWAVIPGKVRWYSAKLVAFLVAVLAVTLTVAWKLFSLLAALLHIGA